MGPGGAYAPDPEAAWHLMVGDLSVLPAIGAALQRSLPASVHVLVELDDEADRQELTRPGRPARDLAARRWRRRRPARGGPRARVPCRPGARLRPRRGLSRPRRPRHLLVDREIPREALSISGYWKRTSTDEEWREYKAEWNRLAEQDVA
jgi:NADPH-dependent ferric siderophore reductase